MRTKNAKTGEVATPIRKMVTFTLILTSLIFLSGCGEQSKNNVVSRKTGHILRMDTGLVIKYISPKGVVSLGKSGSKASVDRTYLNRLPRPFVLQGKAKIGDPVILAYAYEDLLLETGEVRRQFTAIKVLSKNDEHWETYFTQSKVEEKPPGTQSNQ